VRRAFPLALVAVLAFTPRGRADDWPQFRGDPQLTGVARSAPPAQLAVLWTFEAGGAVESSAAIAGGVVYVGTRTGALVALDLATGKLRWRYETSSEIGESSPAVADGVVYVGDL
jgi:eukaryotic-like serine/threonine-protein kinase